MSDTNPTKLRPTRKETGQTSISIEDIPRLQHTLRAIASMKARNEQAYVQTTSLMIAGVKKLFSGHQDVDRWPDTIDFDNRKQFFMRFARVIDQTLIDRARYNKAKRRDIRQTVTFDAANFETLPALADQDPSHFIDLYDALNRLSDRDKQLGEIIAIRWFDGCTRDETARILEINPSKVRRLEAQALAWLAVRLTSDDTE